MHMLLWYNFKRCLGETLVGAQYYGDGHGGGIEELPGLLLLSYINKPTPENQANVRKVFEKLRADIVSHFGEKFAKELACELRVTKA